MEWETVIGLEIHAQLATRSKIFSGASTAYGAEANTQACAIDLGLPGVLPVLNAEAVRMAALFGLAIGANVAERSVFARKNYFYPDLPKGYQISQYEHPIVLGGTITITTNGTEKVIGVTRAHLEEDAGKSLHENYQGMTGIDLNRAGTPLLEIVSEPDMRSAEEAVAYMRAVHQLVRFLAICDGNMQEGSFRCDANVSVRRNPTDPLGTRTELKNLNSFRFIERAIEFEVQRQIEVITTGGQVKQETRLYDPANDETRPMRSKEEANDYRYFPDPDLLPVTISHDQLQQWKDSLPELPDAKRRRFESEYGLPSSDAIALTASPELAEYFECAVSATAGLAKPVANWVMGELTAALNRDSVDVASAPITPADLGTLVTRINDGTISGKLGKIAFEAMWNGEGDVDAVIRERGLVTVSDTATLEALVDEALAAHPTQVTNYLAGKEKLLGFFVGQVMKASDGKANPAEVNRILKARLRRQ